MKQASGFSLAPASPISKRKITLRFMHQTSHYVKRPKATVILSSLKYEELSIIAIVMIYYLRFSRQLSPELLSCFYFLLWISLHIITHDFDIVIMMLRIAPFCFIMAQWIVKNFISFTIHANQCILITRDQFQISWYFLTP